MIFKETEVYQLDGKRQELPGFDDKYLNIIDYILKITEEIWEQRAVWVIYETYDENIVVHSGASSFQGVEEVVTGTLKTLSSFPNRKMLGEAVIWSKVDDNYFYSSHRIASTATNIGDTDFGPATGNKVFFRTIADCLITENKIVEEWLVRDNLHLVQQLGFDPVRMAKRDQRYVLAGKINQDINQAKHSKKITSSSYDLTKPGELVASLFEEVWHTQQFHLLDNYYHVLATVHSICDQDLIGSRQLRKYLEELFRSFPNARVQVERITCNEKDAITEVAARWKIVGLHSGDGFFSPASGKQLIIPGISHFMIKDGKIAEEWMVFDGFDVLCQIHADIEREIHFSQNGKDDIHLINKKMVYSFLQKMNKVGTGKKQVDTVLKKYLSEKVILNITKPYSEIRGIKGYANDFWLPLLDAFPDLENQPYILLGGEYEGRNYVSFTGNLIGTFQKTWLNIPPTNQPTWIRYAGHFLIENGEIVKAWYFLDILDVMRQAGFNFFPNRGIEWVPPGPMTGDGIVIYPTNALESEKSLALTNAMLDGLGDYDGRTLESMGQERFWDVQNMMWYGPSGIGTTRGLKGFQNHHQIPFLTGFPDRGITPKKGKDYFTQIGDGNYSCDFGFPAMYGSHNGDDWLGLKATNTTVTMRVVDYWRREGDQLKENWVLIDIIDLLEQLGVDVFELMKEEIKNQKTSKVDQRGK